MRVQANAPHELNADDIAKYYPDPYSLVTIEGVSYHPTWFGIVDEMFASGDPDLDRMRARYGMAWSYFTGLPAPISCWDPDKEVWKDFTAITYADSGLSLEANYIVAPVWATTVTRLAKQLVKSNALIYGVMDIDRTIQPTTRSELQVGTGAHFGIDLSGSPDLPMYLWADFTGSRRANGDYAVFQLDVEDTILGNELAALGRPVVFAVDGSGSITGTSASDLVTNVMTAIAAAAPGNSIPWLVIKGSDYGNIQQFGDVDDIPSMTVISGVGITAENAITAGDATYFTDTGGGGDTAESMYEPLYWGLRKIGHPDPVVVWYTDTSPCTPWGPGIRSVTPARRLWPRTDYAGPAMGRIFPAPDTPQSGPRTGANAPL